MIAVIKSIFSSLLGEIDDKKWKKFRRKSSLTPEKETNWKIVKFW